MTLLVALFLCAGVIAGIVFGRAAGSADVELQVRVGIPAGIGILLFGIHTIAITTVGSSGASGTLAAIAAGFLSYAVAFAIAGYTARGVKKAGEALHRGGKTDGSDSDTTAEKDTAANSVKREPPRGR